MSEEVKNDTYIPIRSELITDYKGKVIIQFWDRKGIPARIKQVFDTEEEAIAYASGYGCSSTKIDYGAVTGSVPFNPQYSVTVTNNNNWSNILQARTYVSYKRNFDWPLTPKEKFQEDMEEQQEKEMYGY